MWWLLGCRPACKQSIRTYDWPRMRVVTLHLEPQATASQDQRPVQSLSAVPSDSSELPSAALGKNGRELEQPSSRRWGCALEDVSKPCVEMLIGTGSGLLAASSTPEAASFRAPSRRSSPQRFHRTLQILRSRQHRRLYFDVWEVRLRGFGVFV